MDFKLAEKKFKQLKTQFEFGKLSETELKSQLSELMLQDKQGKWWMIGYETESWYFHDGGKWVQKNPPSSLSTYIPVWATIYWIMLGWAIGSAFGIAIGNAIRRDFVSIIGWALGGAISGAIGGFITTTNLRDEKTVSDWKRILWITLAWAIGSTAAWALEGAAISWAIGGIAIAINLWDEKTISDAKSMLWIALAWAIGSTIALYISQNISKVITGDTGWIIGWALGGAIGGAIGGFVTVVVIRRNK